MSGQPTEIYSAANTQQAYLLKGLLEDRGIAAWVINDAIQIAGGELPVGWRAAAKVVVGEADAQEARQVAEEFDQQTAHGPTPDLKQAAAPQEWADWPRCPQCGERRSARCTVCGLPGDNFPLADIDDSGPRPRVLLICQSCDDHFLPEWFRLCHRCGYDYGEGIDVESPGRATDALNARAIALLLLLAGSVVGLVAYFAWLLSA